MTMMMMMMMMMMTTTTKKAALLCSEPKILVRFNSLVINQQ